VAVVATLSVYCKWTVMGEDQRGNPLQFERKYHKLITNYPIYKSPFYEFDI